MDLIGTLCEIVLGLLDLLSPFLHPVEFFLNLWLDILNGVGPGL